MPGVTDARDAALSPDASRAAVVEPGGVRLLDVTTGDVFETYRHPGAISAAISQDNTRVLTGGRDDRVVVWSGQSGRRIQTLVEHEGNAAALDFSPDGSLVASAGSDGAGRLWRTSDWGLAAVVTGHTHALTDVSFSADSEHVVTAGKDGTARISHADTGDQLLVLSGSTSWVTSAVFTDDVGSPVVTAGVDGSIRVWDSVFQPDLALLKRLPASVIHLEAAEDGRIRATARDGRGRTLDPATGDVLAVSSGKRPPRRVVGPNGDVAIIRGRTVVLETAAGMRTLEGHRDRVTSAAFSEDGTLLVTASLDHDARIWTVPDGELLRALQHNTAVHDARFSPDGRWVLTAANRVGLWDVHDGSNELRFQGHEGTATSSTFTADGRTIVSGGVDGTVRTFDCDICGGLDELLAIADRRLTATGRELTPEERERYLG
jgi:WD40 repeat protein